MWAHHVWNGDDNSLTMTSQQLNWTHARLATMRHTVFTSSNIQQVKQITRCDSQNPGTRVTGTFKYSFTYSIVLIFSLCQKLNFNYSVCNFITIQFIWYSKILLPAIEYKARKNLIGLSGIKCFPQWHKHKADKEVTQMTGTWLIVKQQQVSLFEWC